MKMIRYSLATLMTVVLLAASVIVTATLAVAEEQQVKIEQVEQKTISVNLNSATAEELAEKLVGIGAARAELIVEYRNANGPFTAVEQLLEVKGVGAVTLDKNRDKIQL